MKRLINKVVISILFCSVFTLTDAQTLSTSSNVGLDGVQSRMVVNGDGTGRSNALGSPYIDENFAPIRITKFKDKIYSGRYNAYINEMEVTIEDGSIIALNPKSGYEVTFISTNKVYQAVNYVNEDNQSKTGFLVVLSKNEKCSLYKEEHIKFYDKVGAVTSYDKEKPAKYDRISDDYYVELDGKITFLPQKKKDFLSSFPKQEKELKSYMKENKLNPKNEDELISLIEYLSTIIE